LFVSTDLVRGAKPRKSASNSNKSRGYDETRP
jgi:hypothetical protein